MTGHIHIEGEIGKIKDGGEVEVKTVRDYIALYPEATEFEVHVNSVGGDVYEGQAIGNIIEELRKKGIKTVAKIGSLCASIATFIAESCDKVVMGPAGDFMIHLPTGTLNGNAEDLRKGAAQLDRITSELIAQYLPRVSKKGVTKERLSEMIKQETSMSPQEALAMGFIDEITPKLKAVAKWDTKIKDMEKDKVEGWFTSIGNKLDKVIDGLKKVKNISVTLEDGSSVESSAEDASALAGSTLSKDGAALPAGSYNTADGYTLVVGEGGKCESMEMKPKEEEVAKLKEENAALKKQLEAATTTVAEQTKEVQAVAKQVSEFKGLADELKKVRAEFEAMKNETFGDKSVPIDGVGKKETKQENIDPQLKMMHEQLGSLVFKN